jgi:hypothetical protein
MSTLIKKDIHVAMISVKAKVAFFFVLRPRAGRF